MTRWGGGGAEVGEITGVVGEVLPREVITEINLDGDGIFDGLGGSSKKKLII